MKVGPYTLVSPVYVAPMAGVTDAPFRKIAREFGAGLACTEMISSEALVRQHRESFRLMDLRWDQRPVSVQLMGGDPAVMAQAARMAEGADLADGLRTVLKEMDGFFTLLVTTRTQFAVIRDSFACKPAVIAETPDYVAMASEYHALAGLPGITGARVFEPMPEEIHVWTR